MLHFKKLLLVWALFLFGAGLHASAAIAQDTATQDKATQDKTAQDKAKQIWQVLDYLAVDYGKAVQNGQIHSQTEYAEMQEFSQTIERQLSQLPATAAKAQLLEQAKKAAQPDCK